MNQSISSKSHSLSRLVWISVGTVINLLMGGIFKPMLAHHGGDITTINGVWAGIAHPLMGLDHVTLIAAVGLLAARKNGCLIWAFAASALMGLMLFLLGLQIPSAWAIAIALLLVGALLTQAETVVTVLLVVGVAIAGFCHGYPHAALIKTVPSSTQVNFLLSFTLTQLTLGYMICGITRRLLPPNINLVLPGLGICGIGVVYLSSAYLL